MPVSRIQEILEQIRQLDDELRDHLQKQQEKVYYHFKGRRIEFEEAVKQHHLAIKQNIFRYIARSQIKNILSAPFIYSMILPMMMLDIFLFVYQQTCFRLYGIKRVDRSEYIVIDRYHLRYLNLIEKINCVYCGYGNGLFAYAKEIGALTEQYWCPIKHAVQTRGAHERNAGFLAYGDGVSYRQKAAVLREEIIATDSD